MRNRHAGGETAQRRAQRARCVALDDQQIGGGHEQVANRCGDLAHVEVRVLFAGEPKVDRLELAQTETLRARAPHAVR